MLRNAFLIFFVLLGVLLAPTGLTAQTIYPTGTTIWDPAAADNGYTLFAAQGGSIVLIDMDGTVVNTWTSPIPGDNLSVVDPLDNGHILAYSGGAFPAPRRTVFELDYDGNVVWEFTLPAWVPTTTAFHHDSERLPNGNTLLLMWQDILVPSISPITLRDDFLIEVTPGGQVVWVWQQWQHYDEFGFDPLQRALISRQGGDWAHANSASVLPPNNHTDPALAAGNIIVSDRFTNTIFIIQKSNGQIVWKLGPGPDHLTHGQHWPHMIPLGLPGEGNILVFDNGSGTGYGERHRAPGQSTIKEIDPVSKAVVWEYTEGKRFWSDIRSSAMRLPNGNTMICSSVKGRMFEVDPTGLIVWEYMSPFETPAGLSFDRSVYRAYRVPYSWKP